MRLDLILLTPTHLADMQALCAANLPLDPFTLPVLRRRIFEDPRYDPALSLGALVDGRLAGVAVGVVRTLPDGGRRGWIKLLAVDRPQRRRGIATAFITELEKRFRALNVSQLDTIGAPYYLWPGVDVRYTPACCLFERLGFVEKRYTVNMGVDLAGRSFDTTDAERQLAAEGLVLCRADAASMPRILSFIGKEWLLWTYEVPIALTNDPVSLFYVSEGAEVVAFAAYDVAMFPGTFGPTGTAASHRRRGIGGLLLDKCFQDMQSLGYKRCEIAWTGPVGFYADKAGAAICRVFRDYQKPLQAQP